MRDQKETGRGLTMTWVPVRDANGRVHMEARWSVPASSHTKPRPHAA